MESLSQMGRGEVRKEKAAGFLTGADVHEEELIVMAETAAYFHVAYKVSTLSHFFDVSTHDETLP